MKVSANVLALAQLACLASAARLEITCADGVQTVVDTCTNGLEVGKDVSEWTTFKNCDVKLRYQSGGCCGGPGIKLIPHDGPWANYRIAQNGTVSNDKCPRGPWYSDTHKKSKKPANATEPAQPR